MHTDPASRGRPGRWLGPRRRALVPLLVTLHLAACAPTAADDCSRDCAPGQPCPAAEACEADDLPTFDGDPPGFAAALAAGEDALYLASIDPVTRSLLVGAVAEDGPRLHVVHEFQRLVDPHIALAANAGEVALAWLHDDGHYRLAQRPQDGPAARWTIRRFAGSSERAYAGSRDFDLAIDNAGATHLAFRDARAGDLTHLLVDPSGAWSLSTIDASPTLDDESCPDGALRSRATGVGHDPALLSRGSDLLVAYQDRSCGDLKLARRLENTWAASTTARGAPTTGGHPDIAVDSAGNIGLAFRDVSRARLVFAFQDDGEFRFEIVDDGVVVDEFSQRRKHLVGHFASLVFDDDDIPWIAYMNSTTSTLMIAERSSIANRDGDWSRRPLDAAAPVGFSATLVESPEARLSLSAEAVRPSDQGVSSRWRIFRDQELR